MASHYRHCRAGQSEPSYHLSHSGDQVSMRGWGESLYAADSVRAQSLIYMSIRECEKPSKTQ
jgi:hypothetical protein